MSNKTRVTITYHAPTERERIKPFELINTYGRVRRLDRLCESIYRVSVYVENIDTDEMILALQDTGMFLLQFSVEGGHIEFEHTRFKEMVGKRSNAST